MFINLSYLVRKILGFSCFFLYGKKSMGYWLSDSFTWKSTWEKERRREIERNKLLEELMSMVSRLEDSVYLELAEVIIKYLQSKG